MGRWVRVFYFGPDDWAMVGIDNEWIDGDG